LPPLPDMVIGQAFPSEEAVSVLDFGYQGLQFDQSVNMANPNRFSGSSMSMSTTGALSDINSYDGASSFSEAQVSYGSEYRPLSTQTSLMSAPLSPVTSPRLPSHVRRDLTRTMSRSRASPPRSSARSAPYTIEVRSKRWSTGTYGTPQQQPVLQTFQPCLEAAMRELADGLSLIIT
jgi:hypothetical protein